VAIIRGRVGSLAAAEEGWLLYADGEWHSFDHIVLACGANHSSALLASIDPELSALLAAIPYNGSSIWTFGYLAEQVKRPLDAFGFLVPRAERNTMMACTWVGTKWPGRIPHDKAVFRCFSTDVAATHEAMEADLKRLVPIDGDPLFALCNRWPASMPQYTVGHTARAAKITERIAQIPGLHIAGNAYDGIGIPDCVRTAKKAAEAIRAA
jgi:oxygen-dependent protoporphyrinogen oxidase